MARPRLALCSLSLAATLTGCASSPSAPAVLEPRNTPRAVSTPVAVMGRGTVTLAEIAPALLELAGPQALEEHALDQALIARCREQGLQITPADAQAEASLFLRAIADEANLAEREAAQTLERIRATRGLGPVRFAALLDRNARLRALVRGQVNPTDEQLQTEWAIASGQRYRVRLITSSSQSLLTQLREQLLARNGPERSDLFARLAISHSDDLSARQGGLVDALSPADPAVPAVLRSTLPTLAPSDVSPVLLFEAGFAVVLLESPLPPLEVESPEARDRVAQRLRLRLERFAMDRLARELVANADLTALDPSLGWAREQSTQ